jgi:hypothetical protein
VITMPTAPSPTRPFQTALPCALLLGALLACATTPPAQPTQAPAQSLPSAADTAQPEVYKPGPPTVQTAGAAQPAAQAPAPECATVDDCATSRYEEGACCATLCQPRATTKKAVEEKARQNCATLVRCAQPLCLPPRVQHQLACQQGRCVMQRVASPLQSE